MSSKSVRYRPPKIRIPGGKSSRSLWDWGFLGKLHERDFDKSCMTSGLVLKGGGRRLYKWLGGEEHYCSCRGPWVSFQHPQGSMQLSVTIVPGPATLFWTLNIHMIYIHICRQSTHIHKSEKKMKDLSQGHQKDTCGTNINTGVL